MLSDEEEENIFLLIVSSLRFYFYFHAPIGRSKFIIRVIKEHCFADVRLSTQQPGDCKKITQIYANVPPSFG